MPIPVGDAASRDQDSTHRQRSPRRQLAFAVLVVAALFLLGTPVATAVARTALASGTPAAATDPARAPGVSGSAPAAAVNGGFVTRSGENLVLNGKPFTFVGFNINNANGRRTCDWKNPGMTIDQSLDAIGASQQVFRAWFFQALVTKGGRIDWSIFDHTVAAAASHGERIIAVLGNQWDTCDSGAYRSENWYRTGYAKAPDGPNSPLSYTDWVKAVVSRYANNPTIVAWQLLNEAEDAASKGGACSSTAPATLRSWAHTVAALVKSLDANHLVSIGTAGWGQCGAAGADYEALYADPNVDICNFHDYSNPSTPVLHGPTNGLGARVRQARALGKPLIVDELGVSLPGHAGGSLTTRAGQLDARVGGMLAAGVKGVLIWDFGTPSRTEYDVSAGDPVLPLLTEYGTR